MTHEKMKTPTVWGDPIPYQSHGKTINEVLYAHRDENNKLSEFAVRCAYWAHTLAILSKKEIAQRCAERASQCALLDAEFAGDDAGLASGLCHFQ